MDMSSCLVKAQVINTSQEAPMRADYGIIKTYTGYKQYELLLPQKIGMKIKRFQIHLKGNLSIGQDKKSSKHKRSYP